MLLILTTERNNETIKGEADKGGVEEVAGTDNRDSEWSCYYEADSWKAIEAHLFLVVEEASLEIGLCILFIQQERNRNT